MTHGEGLSGQHAVGNDAAEQLALFHGGQQEADGVVLRGQLTEILVSTEAGKAAAAGEGLTLDASRVIVGDR